MIKVVSVTKWNKKMQRKKPTKKVKTSIPRKRIEQIAKIMKTKLMRMCLTEMIKQRKIKN